MAARGGALCRLAMNVEGIEKVDRLSTRSKLKIRSQVIKLSNMPLDRRLRKRRLYYI